MRKGKQVRVSESADNMAQNELRQETMYRIREYLSTSVFGGIGPVIAGRVVARFGIETVPVIEIVPDRLDDVRGLGEKRKQAIVEGWAMQTRIKKAVSSMTKLIPKTRRRPGRRKKLHAKGKMRERRTSASKKVKKVQWGVTERIAELI
jgi:ATP-dependent exoDNAse (exonuclease V) alpha subunit